MGLVGRAQPKCPWDVPLVIGECGIDMFVKDAGVQHETRGWLGRKSPEAYAAELAEYVGRMSTDDRFVGCRVFAADFANREWASFDIEPAYPAIVAAPIPSYQPDSKPIDTHLPSIGTGQPADETQELPAQPPVPAPRGDDWPRIYAFIQRWEGGFVNDANDPGGATNKGVTLGTYTRWRAAHNQPQPTVADLWAITDAEVEQIFHQWYYVASGADRLPWPLSLAQTDTAINAGVGRAQEMLAKSGGNFLAYLGHLIKWYAAIDGFEHFGRGWMARRGDLLLEASKP